MALAKKVKNLLVLRDSELVVKQVECQYECKDDRLNQYRSRVWSLMNGFKAFNIKTIPRKQNIAADSLAVAASTFQPMEDRRLKQITIQMLYSSSVPDNIETFQVFSDNL